MLRHLCRIGDVLQHVLPRSALGLAQDARLRQPLHSSPALLQTQFDRHTLPSYPRSPGCTRGMCVGGGASKQGVGMCVVGGVQRGMCVSEAEQARQQATKSGGGDGVSAGGYLKTGIGLQSGGEVPIQRCACLHHGLRLVTEHGFTSQRLAQSCDP
jgi:hypothetical protein